MARQINPFESKNVVVDEEFDNFMLKVQDVKKLMDGLTSQDKSVANEALQLVDNYLGTTEKTFDEDSLRVKTNKTVINQKAFDNMKKEGQQETQTPEEFMKSCEADAKRRAEDRRYQKEASDTLKKQAISAFNKGDYERALSFYDRAIDEFRSSTHLYNSRALTCLKLKLYKKTIEDCDLVLRCFNENSLKALLYKAKAHKALGEEEEVKKCVQQAIENHPKSKNEICEYMNDNPTDEN
uniref:Uncharacterized protein n=1 Tax=Graphocephala atropunctata TaxID=36148 RepID=A0A1B6LM21_9HEMI